MKCSKKNIGKLIVRYLLLTLISVIIGCSIYSWNARSLSGNRLPMPFGVGVSVVLSGSMEPALSKGDLVFVKAADTYQEDDIVVYQSGSILVIHRIIETEYAEDGTLSRVVTMGDANGGTADAPISASAVKGKMVGRIPKVGSAVSVLKHPVSVVLILSLAVALLVLSERKERNAERDKLDRIRAELEELKARIEAGESESPPQAQPGTSASEHAADQETPPT